MRDAAARLASVNIPFSWGARAGQKSRSELLPVQNACLRVGGPIRRAPGFSGSSITLCCQTLLPRGRPCRYRHGGPPVDIKQTLAYLCRLSDYINQIKTFNNGSLGSGIDEERSEMR